MPYLNKTNNDTRTFLEAVNPHVKILADGLRDVIKHKKAVNIRLRMHLISVQCIVSEEGETEDNYLELTRLK